MKTRFSSGRPGGFTYMTVIVTMIVVGLMLAAYLKMVDVQNQLTMRSQTWNRTVPVIEAGIEEAMAHLNKNGSPDAGGNFDLSKLSTDGWEQKSDGGWFKWRIIDSDLYMVKIDPWTGGTTNFPMIRATGIVAQLPAFSLRRNPAGPFVAGGDDYWFHSGRFTRRLVECTTTNNPTFSRGLVAKKQIDLNGKNVETDSYNSTNSLYSTNGRYDKTKRRDHGDIASNDTIIDSVYVGNAKVRGNVLTGPKGTVGMNNGIVGDNAFVDDTSNKGKIQEGHFKDDMNVEFPDVVMPSGSGGWPPLPTESSTKTVINGVEYSYDLAGGDYLVSGGDLDKSIYIRGAVRLRVDSGINLTGNNRITIGTNGSLRIYANCQTVNIGGNGVVNENATPISLYYFGTARNTSLSLGGNADFTGVIYAPYANFQLNGSGKPEEYNDFSGAAMINSAKFNGHFRFHYDEALPKIGLWRGFTITSWNER